MVNFWLLIFIVSFISSLVYAATAKQDYISILNGVRSGLSYDEVNDAAKYFAKNDNLIATENAIYFCIRYIHFWKYGNSLVDTAMLVIVNGSSVHLPNDGGNDEFLAILRWHVLTDFMIDFLLRNRLETALDDLKKELDFCLNSILDHKITHVKYVDSFNLFVFPEYAVKCPVARKVLPFISRPYLRTTRESMGLRCCNPRKNIPTISTAIVARLKQAYKRWDKKSPKAVSLLSWWTFFEPPFYSREYTNSYEVVNSWKRIFLMMLLANPVYFKRSSILNALVHEQYNNSPSEFTNLEKEFFLALIIRNGRFELLQRLEKVVTPVCFRSMAQSYLSDDEKRHFLKEYCGLRFKAYLVVLDSFKFGQSKPLNFKIDEDVNVVEMNNILQSYILAGKRMDNCESFFRKLFDKINAKDPSKAGDFVRVISSWIDVNLIGADILDIFMGCLRHGLGSCKSQGRSVYINQSDLTINSHLCPVLSKEDINMGTRREDLVAVLQEIQAGSFPAMKTQDGFLTISECLDPQLMYLVGRTVAFCLLKRVKFHDKLIDPALWDYIFNDDSKVNPILNWWSRLFLLSIVKVRRR